MHGWRMGHSGYLPEADLIFALALFLQAKSLNPDLALACLNHISPRCCGARCEI